ncbi:uncharacterized protein prr5l isoform X1 [Stigmatopora nigra]
MRWRDIVELKMAKISSLFPVSIFNDLLFNILGSFPRPMSGRRRHPVQVGWNVSVKCAIYFPRRVNVGHDRRHPQRPIGGDESLQGRSPAAQRALRAQRERQAAPEERDGRLPQRLLPGNAKTLEKRNARPPGPAKIKGTMLPSEPSAGGRPGRTPGARLPCRRGRATGGRVPSLETFLHRDAPHPAGHFLPRAGERDASPPFPKDQRPAVRRPAGLAFYAGGVGAGVSAQGREPSVRQMALLSFRDAVVLQLPLEDSLANGGANGGGAPPDLTHMLLVLQVPTEGPTEVRTTGAQGLTRPFPAGGARARTVLRPTLPETGATGGRRGLAVPGRRGLGAASAFRVHRRGRLGFATRRGFVADAAAGARGRSLPGESGGGATSHGGQRAPGRGRNLTPARPSGRSGQMGTFWRRRFGYVFLFGSRRVEKQPRAKNKAKRVGSKLFQSFFCTLYTHAHTHTHGDTHTQVHVDARRPSILRSAAVCPSARLVQF